MKTMTLQQGSPEWAAHRARSLNASELSAAMGLSSYITRSALVKQKATGIAPEIDAATQHRFNKGHEFEAIARPWAEEIIGEELFPVVLAGEVDALPLSASLDGQTLTGDVTWEHKSGNATLLARLDAGVIPDEYHPQMEQGLLLSGATRCLFMASSGDREAMRYAWYESNPELRAKIVPTWRQFQADVAAYVPTEPAAPVTAAPMESLPAVVVQVQGALTVGGNLDAFGLALRDFIARIPARPATDQQFANCEASCKALRKAEDALTQAEDGALAQISDVELMRRTVADLKELARSTRLATEKLVKAEKDARRTEKVLAARQAFETHVARLQVDIKGVRLIVPMPDFGGAIKGLSSLASIDDKLTAALLAGQAEANTLAGRIANNLQTLDSVPQYAHLFADRQELAYKDAETLELLMQKRVDAEAERIEAERQRIQAEAERKAKEAA
ncbi:MAG TPA: endonuclease, partial [Aquabacterium sp.]|nr:endonuclease [Aquabacterium sp.]